MRVTTNNVPRDVLTAWDIPAADREEFDYLDWSTVDPSVPKPTADQFGKVYPSKSAEDAQFVRYHGQLYDLGEFEVWDNPASPTRQNWDGYRSDSYFSGIVVRYVAECERVIVGTFYAD